MVGTVVVHEQGQAPDEADEAESPFAFGEPEPVTIDEISRHPSNMPADTDWATYRDGNYTGSVDRLANGNATHEVHFQIEEGVTELLPNTTTELWTFDGTIPGPMIRVQAGDFVDFTLHNPEDNTLPHNVDFHAVTGPGGGAVSLDTDPGATNELNVRLLNPGIYVYHCAWGDVPKHIAHGIYGLVVVEPEEGLPEVDEEH
jgi:nitrite reductase (NO-forming)